MKVRDGYYASVAGKITVLLEVVRGKQCSIDFLFSKTSVFHYDPAGVGTVYKKDMRPLSLSVVKISDEDRLIVWERMNHFP